MSTYIPWLRISDLAAKTGLTDDKARQIVSAFHAAGQHADGIRRNGNRWEVRQDTFATIFAHILDERRLEQEALAQERLLVAEAALETARLNAEARRLRAERHRDIEVNAARARRDAVRDKRRCRPAHYPLAALPRERRG